MGLLRRLYARLRLRVNEGKSAVDLATRRKILGYSFWVARGSIVRRRVGSKALATMKQNVRFITRRTGGRSIEQVRGKLRSYLLGWKEYFHLADAPSIFANLDEWIRHRLRAIHLKHWKQGTTIYRELRARGLPRSQPRGSPPMAGAGGRTRGCSSISPSPSATSTNWESPGWPRDLNEPPGADPHAG